MDLQIEPGMYVSVESFSQHLEYLSTHFDILPLRDIAGASSLPLSKQGKPCCAITFDDGWLDFLLHAVPHLLQYNVPATVFLPTNFIGTDKVFWTDTVAALFSCKDKRQRLLAAAVEIDQLRANCVTQCLLQADARSEERRLDQVITGLKRHCAAEIYCALDELRGIVGEVTSTKQRVFLNWDEVRSLKETGLITFGSHTADHNILTTIQPREVRCELDLSREKLIAERAVSPDEPLFFCYPNGNATHEIAAMVKSANYAAAVTTRKGWNERSENCFLLKRVGLHQDMSSTKAMFACRLAEYI